MDRLARVGRASDAISAAETPPEVIRAGTDDTADMGARHTGAATDCAADGPADADRVLATVAPWRAVGERLCGRLLAGESDGAPENYLTITFRTSPADRLEHWRTHVDADLPSNVGVVAVGDRTRGAAAVDTATGPVAIPGADADVRVSTVASPADLTGVGMAASDLLSRWEGDGRTVVCLDSLTTLLQYTDARRSYRFLHALLGRLDATPGTVHAHLDPAAHDRATTSILESLFDRHADGGAGRLRS